MTSTTATLGVIEGFYGHPWDDSTRLDMLAWLPRIGIDAYMYAPKANHWLRRQWREPWPASQLDLIRNLTAKGRASGIEVSVGFSPFALYQSYDAVARRLLRECILRLREAGVQSLAILFDDMPGAMDALARRQAEIIDDVREWGGFKDLRVCPTYYSDDPILDELFGDRPPGYLEELGALLPADCSVFWTGPEVCSHTIRSAHVASIAHRLGRPLALWDNYPVNDSRSRSPHLYLAPLEGRDSELAASLESHWCNAMNQAALSLPALASLAALHGRNPGGLADVLAAAGVTAELAAACLPLAVHRLEELEAPEREALDRLAQGESIAAFELERWLDGHYVFDPACLTD